MNEHSHEEETAYMDTTSPPMLHSDGVTVLVPLRGRTADGIYYDGAQQITPGDPRYDELLPVARANPAPPPPTTEKGNIDPETLDMLRQASGFE